MALVNAKCPRCGGAIQLDSGQKVCFCLYCGGRIVVAAAIRLLLKERGALSPEPTPPPPGELIARAGEFLESGAFTDARRIYESVFASDKKNTEALWGLVLCKTENLSPRPLKDPEDFARGAARDLFDREGVPSEWREAYDGAFWECCLKTLGEVDPKVFLEAEIFKWNPAGNAFAYPVSRQFDANTVVDRELAPAWSSLAQALPPERGDDFERLCGEKRAAIVSYFRSGFSNLDDISRGDFSKLAGAWSLKLTTGEVKADVLCFAVNAAGLPFCEGYRLSISGYDYYRGISLSGRDRIVARERRHFPSVRGTGGDFERGESPVPAFDLVAVYDYLLIMPTALFVRADIAKIPGIERARSFAEKCRAMPSFSREGIKASAQYRPICENHDTAEPSRTVRACYIATAVYGDVDAPEVRVLRAFRDGPMQRSWAGRSLSALYYRFSPPLAAKLAGAKAPNRAARRVLDVFVRLLEKRFGGNLM